MGKEAAARITLRSVEDWKHSPPPCRRWPTTSTTMHAGPAVAHDRGARCRSPAPTISNVTRHLHEALADIDADPQRDRVAASKAKTGCHTPRARAAGQPVA
jgi:malonate decarboxylase gamma subunit